MKRITRLTESDLHRIVRESVKRVLNEVSTDTLHNAYQKSQDLTKTLQAFLNISSKRSVALHLRVFQRQTCSSM